MIDFASAALRCDSPESAQLAADTAASELKLGKALYRLRTDQHFEFWFALPGSTAVYADDLKNPEGHPLKLCYEVDPSRSAAALALAGVKLLGAATLIDEGIDFALESKRGVRLNIHRSLRSTSPSLSTQGDFAFLLIEWGSNEAPEVLAGLLTNTAFQAVPPDAAVHLAWGELGSPGSDISPPFHAAILDQVRQKPCKSISLRANWEELGPALLRVVQSFMEQDELTEGYIWISTNSERAESRVAELSDALQHPTSVSLHSFYPSRKWSPFLPTPALQGAKPTRYQLYARERGAFRTQLDIVHRHEADPLLELQVVDRSGRGRATTELAKLLGDRPGWKVWTGDPWNRWDGWIG